VGKKHDFQRKRTLLFGVCKKARKCLPRQVNVRNCRTTDCKSKLAAVAARIARQQHNGSDSDALAKQQQQQQQYQSKASGAHTTKINFRAREKNQQQIAR